MLNSEFRRVKYIIPIGLSIIQKRRRLSDIAGNKDIYL